MQGKKTSPLVDYNPSTTIVLGNSKEGYTVVYPYGVSKMFLVDRDNANKSPLTWRVLTQVQKEQISVQLN